MTIQQFDKIKCGDLAYVCFHKNPPTGQIIEINRTKKTIKVFGAKRNYSYRLINLGFAPGSCSMWGWASETNLIERLEAVLK